MTRCKVTREPTHDGHHWLVETPHGDWDNYNTFDTFQEAIQFADQMARTVEVTLPRKTTGIKIGKHTTASVSHANRGAIALTLHDKTKDPVVIFVKGNRIKSLALALLKYHYTQEHT